MGDMGDKMRHAGEDIGGKVKEGVGDMTDNERLEREGQMDQAKASAKKAGDNVKDAFDNAVGKDD
jgi:uncharacterized protein YjbJ (UPF0337 family)